MLIIRPAQLSDAMSIASLHVVSWQSAYRDILPESFLENLSIQQRLLNWTRILEAKECQVSLACLKDELAGWVSYGKSRDNEGGDLWGEIHAIYLSPAHLRKGIGSALMSQAIAELRGLRYSHVSVWVLEKNILARIFYERLGFQAEAATKSVEIGGVSVAEIRYSRSLEQSQI